jgi:hypothetical protein
MYLYIYMHTCMYAYIYIHIYAYKHMHRLEQCRRVYVHIHILTGLRIQVGQIIGLDSLVCDMCIAMSTPTCASALEQRRLYTYKHMHHIGAAFGHCHSHVDHVGVATQKTVLTIRKPACAIHTSASTRTYTLMCAYIKSTWAYICMHMMHVQATR